MFKISFSSKFPKFKVLSGFFNLNCQVLGFSRFFRIPGFWQPCHSSDLQNSRLLINITIWYLLTRLLPTYFLKLLIFVAIVTILMYKNKINILIKIKQAQGNLILLTVLVLSSSTYPILNIFKVYLSQYFSYINRF